MNSSSERVRTRVLHGSSVTALAVAAPEFDASLEDARGQRIAVDPRIVEESRALGFAEGRRAGHDEGFERGRADGLAAAAAEIEALEHHAQHDIAQLQEVVQRLIHAFEHAVDEQTRRIDAIDARSEQQIAAGAARLASAIVAREIADSETRAADALGRALALAPERGDMVARLHPDDAATLERLDAASERIRIEADPTLAPGDCLLEFSNGEVDARISAALARAHALIERGTE